MDKKMAVVTLVFLGVGLALSPLSSAQGVDQASLPVRRVVSPAPLPRPGAVPTRPGMPGMKGMMIHNMVATADGGVVMISGDKLIKYDKDLNIVTEVEVKGDVPGM